MRTHRLRSWRPIDASHQSARARVCSLAAAVAAERPRCVWTGKKEEEDAERHRLAEHMRNQSFVHSDILKDKLDEVRSRPLRCAVVVAHHV